MTGRWTYRGSAAGVLVLVAVAAAIAWADRSGTTAVMEYWMLCVVRLSSNAMKSIVEVS